MTRQQAHSLTRELLKKYNLPEWNVRITLSTNSYGLCDYKSKTIFISAIHVDTMHDSEVEDTIKHEIAHALVGPSNGHNIIWQEKAKELGARPVACSLFAIPEHVLDAIRGGATVTIEEETIKIPKYTISRLQEVCPECGKPAKEKFSIKLPDKDNNEVRLITLECLHTIKKTIPKGTPFHTLVSNWHKPEITACKHDWGTPSFPNQCKECGEFKLYDFQVDGCRFAEEALATGKGVGIFDQQGLGKTPQALAVIHFKKTYKTLYVVKSSLTFNFFKEILRWLGPDYFPQIIKTSKDYIFPNLKSYIISYDLIRRMPEGKLASIGFNLVILDECQQIKNVDSTRTQEVRKLVGGDVQVMELSGTPWNNRGSELFPGLNIIDPIKFWSPADFTKKWVKFNYDENGKKKEGGINNPKLFREYIKNIVIRRERKDVLKELPAINRTKLHLELDELEQKTYQDATSEFVKWYNDKVLSGEEDTISGLELLAKMSRMRHILGLAKIPATVAYVEEFIDDEEDNLIIFVHHQDVGRILADEIQKKVDESGEKINVLQFTSSLDSGERFAVETKFNTSRSIMIASTKASGEGLNLQYRCHKIVMHERQWNPGTEEQAEDRIVRIGQMADKLDAIYPHGEETMDVDFDSIIERKRRQFHEVMNEGEMPEWDVDDIGKQLAERIVSKFNKAQSLKAKNKSITKQVQLRRVK